MALYHPKHRKQAAALKPELKAMVVHSFLKKVQQYSEEMIEKKWKATRKQRGTDLETLQKLAHWVQYHRFNAVALEEIEDGTLDAWFEE
ncbi:MAG: hypothetical protein HY282_02675 [Nitrospirae bacterium]|nr:hypothetical protein [Candidatus Manganitrophaceae bacterium]